VRVVQTLELDVHGLTRVRLVDATPSDVAAVLGRIGVHRPSVVVPGAPAADLTIRYVDRLDAGSPLSLLGQDDAAFTDEAFFVVRSRRRGRRRVAIPMASVGGSCEIVAERGIGDVPLLVSILNLTILANGALPLHGAAFATTAGTGVVATGWSKGGKTEALLAFAQHGARFIADEWAYLSADGTQVFGLRDYIRVWDWHLEDLPATRARLGRVTRARLAALTLVGSASSSLPRAAGGARTDRLVDRLSRAIEGERHVDTAPETLFGDDLGSLAGPFNCLFLMTSAEVRRTTVDPVDPLEVAARMAFSLRHERHELAACYDKFRYAFPEPEAANPVLEGAAEAEGTLLRQVFAGKPAWRIEHPRPVPLADLYEAMAPYV